MSIRLYNNSGGYIDLNAGGTGSTANTFTLPAETGTILTSASSLAAASLTGNVASARIVSALNAEGSAPIYACRAWATFNGTGTPEIRASGNVSSITDYGTGDYGISFVTNMPDANYTIVGASVKAAGSPSGDNSAFVTMGEAPSVSGTGVGMLTANGGNLDRGYVYIAVFR